MIMVKIQLIDLRRKYDNVYVENRMLTQKGLSSSELHTIKAKWYFIRIF